MKKSFVFASIASLLVCNSWATMPTTSNMGDWRKAYARYRFAVDAPRSDNSSMQLSEIQLLDGNRERISSGYANDWDSVTKGSNGNKFPSGQTPDKAVDGDVGSKWLDWRAGLSNSDETRSAAWLEFRFDEPTKIYGYRWYTANDWAPRDPVAWTLSAFDDDDGTWHVLDKVTGYNTPWQRMSLAYECFLNCTDWVNETAEYRSYTGAWTRNVAYGSDGKADILGDNAFVPYSASTGNVVTVEVKTLLKGVELDIAGNQENDVQAAVCLSTNGAFQVWSKAGNGELGTGNGWVEVAAEGVTPVSGKEYTLRFTVNYLANRYSVEVKDGNQWKALKHSASNSSTFRLACASDRVSEVSFSGGTRLTSILGNSVVIEGFVADEKVFVDNNVSIFLSAAQAAWLNSCSGSKGDVSSALAHVPSAEIFNDAYLLNFDITDGEFDYDFEITGIEVLEDCVKVKVTLVRNGYTNGPINGTLKFYGAETLAAFKSGTATPLESKTLVDDDFSDGATTTATFDKDDNVFFDAKIEEK